MSALLEIEGLTVEIPTASGPAAVVRGLDLDVGAGGSVGLVGESGCGKTVSMLAVLGLLPDHARVSGSVRYRGEPVDTPAKVAALRGAHIGMVFQDAMRSLNPLIKVGAQVAESVRVHRHVRRREARREAIRYLERVGLESPATLYEQYPHELSGGMRQRVMIAGALASGPELLIADESTTGLDVTVQAQVLDLLREVRRDSGIALIFISHDLAVVSDICDEVSVVYGGRVVEHGPTGDVLERPRHPYTRALLDALPELGNPRPLRGIAGLPPTPGAFPSGCSFAPRCAHADSGCAEHAPPAVTVTGRRVVECWLEVDGHG